MKVKSLQKLQFVEIKEDTRKYVRQSTAGFFLGVLFLYGVLLLLNALGNMDSTVEIPSLATVKQTLDAEKMVPVLPTERFRERLAGTDVVMDVLRLPDNQTFQLSAGIGHYNRKDSVCDEKTSITLPADQELEQINASTPAVPAVLSYSGTLRQDYCVGSSVNLSGMVMEWKQGKEEKQVPISNCEVRGMDTRTPGEKVLTVTYNGSTAEIPYGVADYRVVLNGNGGTAAQNQVSLKDYKLNAEVVQVPRRLGKEFDGWYRDKQCTVPFTEALPGEVSLNLYAGWKEFGKFVCDDTGKITGYSGTGSDLTDFTLRIPGHADCTGIGKGAFTALGASAFEAYIPSNITYIEPGTFDELTNMIFIYVDPANPNYCSINGVVYTKDKSQIVIFPLGQTGWPKK